MKNNDRSRTRGQIAAALLAALAGAALLPAHAVPLTVDAGPDARAATLSFDPRPSTLRIPAPRLDASDAKVRIEATFAFAYLPAGSVAGQGYVCEDTPAAARTAIEYAGRLWGVHLAAQFPVRVAVCWTTLPAGALARAFVNGYAGGLAFPLANTLYPAALVNAMTAVADSPYTQMTLAITASPAVPWHFGTDANPGASLDLVTATMNALTHGLGFISFAQVYNGNGWITSLGLPAVYDRFTKDGAGTELTAYTEPSAALAAALQSGAIHFHGANAKAANGGNPVPLHSPAVFSPESHVHLAGGYEGTPDALMTPALSPGKAVHRPGPITLGMLKDMGWIVAAVSSVADLAASQSSSAAATTTGRDVIFTMEVSNRGPDSALGVIGTADFDPASTAVWTSPGCVLAYGTHYDCALGNLAPGATARASIVLRKAAPGTMRNTTGTYAIGVGDIDHANDSVTLDVPVGASPAATPVQRYRLYSPVTKEHHFTTDANEYATLGTYVGTWVQEGGVGKVLDNPGSHNGVVATPYYRLYNTGNAQHHWTTDPNEYYTLIQFPQFNAERIGCWILPTQAAGTIPLYRLMYPYSVPVAGLHHWTIDANEYNALIASYGWIGEGGSGYVIP